MTNQTKKLMVKAKAMYHVGDLSLTIRRGEVVQLSEADANKSNDLWRGQQFGLLEVKWVYAGVEVVVPKPKAEPVSKEKLQAHTQQVLTQAKPEPRDADIHELRQDLTALRNDLTAVSKKAEQAKVELKAEIARLEAKLAELTEPKSMPMTRRKKETTDAGAAEVE